MVVYIIDQETEVGYQVHTLNKWNTNIFLFEPILITVMLIIYLYHPIIKHLLNT
jgi:hypothetical protein